MKNFAIFFLSWSIFILARPAAHAAGPWDWDAEQSHAGGITIGGIHIPDPGTGPGAGAGRFSPQHPGGLAGNEVFLPGAPDGEDGQALEGIKNLYAALSKCSYSKKECQLPPGWRKLSDAEKRQLGLDPKHFDSVSGFHAELFRNLDGSYVLGFEGTDSLRDWGANLEQGALPFLAVQYYQAARLAREADKTLGNRLLFTGHSLGGGLASLAAILTGNRAITFNAAGLNPATVTMNALPLLAKHDHRLKKLVELDANWLRQDELVTSFRVRGDELTAFQEKMKRTGVPALMALAMLAPDAAGRKVELENPPGLFEHGIDSVIAAPLR